MGKIYQQIDASLSDWLAQQQMFFVATAPLSADGRVNVSPKGGDSFRILGPNEVAYQDYTGSGIETMAHLRENGRIVLMFCAFTGPPKILRLHGRGEAIRRDDPRYAGLAAQFPAHPGARALVRVDVTRVSDSCGFSVPLYEFQQPRTVLDQWAQGKTADELREYRNTRNGQSIDGLPGWDSD